MKKKVLIVCCNGLGKGGIQAVIMSIVDNLHEEFDFDAIVFQPGNQYYSEDFMKYGNIYHFHNKGIRNIIKRNIDEMFREVIYSVEFNRFLKSHGPYDIIHCHDYFESAPFLRIAARNNIPVRIAHSHNVASILKRKNPFYAILTKHYKNELRKYANVKIACSAEAGYYLFDESVKVVNNAIDLDKFNPDKYSSVEKNVDYQFIHVGSFSIQKNQLFLIDVFYHFLKLNMNVKLVLVGSGKLEMQVKEKIRRLKIDDKVEVLPSNSDIPKLLSESDAMIFPSTYEGLGISLIEAQVMGLKCYVSDRIQPEADMGRIKVIDLNIGAQKWAEVIYNDIRQNGLSKEKVDSHLFDIRAVIDEYRKIYNQELF